MATILQRLLSILSTFEGEGDDDSGTTTTTTTTTEKGDTMVGRLSQWNDEVEEFLRLAQRRRSRARDNNHPTAAAAAAAADLDSATIVSKCGDNDEHNDDDSDDDVTQLQVSSLLLHAFSHVVHGGALSDNNRWDHSQNRIDWNMDNSSVVACCSDEWMELLRTVQNWLQWYLQRRSLSSSAAATLDAWNTQPMLKFYLELVEQYLLIQPVAVSISPPPPLQNHKATTKARAAEAARHASNILFYATFGLVVANQSRSAKVLSLLIAQADWMPRLLRLLCFAPDQNVGLLLSLMRNVHVAVASVSRTSHPTILLHVACNLSTARNPGGGGGGGSNDNGVGVDPPRTPAVWARTLPDSSISYSVALREMAWQAVQFVTNDDHNPHDQRQQEQRFELVTEILRCGYALQMGRHRHLEHMHWNRVAETILQWDDANDSCYECQLAILALLMDADATILCRIVAVPECQDSLRNILERQVSTSCIATHDTATLTPILVVLYKAAQACSAYCAVLRESIFPDADAFCEAVARQDALRATDMAPLEPEINGSVEGGETLRRNLVSLLTSPQSFVKRCTGELLFLLCHSQPREFVHRVGMGNALPLLASKGLVQLPS
jgi:Guanine nucleotide exchange factor synembryn